MRHSIPASILRARMRASTATAEALEPFQHAREASERSGAGTSGAWGRSGAGAYIGARSKKMRRKEERELSQAKSSVSRRQRSRRVRVRSEPCARRARGEGARELEQSGSNGERRVAARGRRNKVREKEPR